MLPLVTVATSLADRVLKRKKGESAKELKTIIKTHLSSDDLTIYRDADHYLAASRALAQPSEAYSTGEAPAGGDGNPVAWKQFSWTEPKTLGECTWTGVTWRVYATGLIAYQAQMTNVSTGLDVGDSQGHRLELRTGDGWMLGAWKANFFVYRQNAVQSFSGYFEDEHKLLALHFADLAETQEGIWYHGGARREFRV